MLYIPINNNIHYNHKHINMKGLLITACSLFLFGATYAQDNKSDSRSDDDASPSTNAATMDGMPMPDHKHFHADVLPWNHVQTVAIAPFQYSENGVGVGASWERALDADGIVAVYVPLIATWNFNNNNNYYYNTNNSYYNSMYYAMPGIKFYPTGMGRVKYAVGPSAVIGVGKKMMDNNYVVDPYYYNTVTYGTMESRFLFGMMINNSLNVNATPHLYIGAEMGFGFSYFDRVNNINHGMSALTQGSFKIGYTF